jgi:hypothetical protein
VSTAAAAVMAVDTHIAAVEVVRGPMTGEGRVRPTARGQHPGPGADVGPCFHADIRASAPSQLTVNPAVPRGDRDQYPGGGGTGVYTTPLLPYPAAYQVVPHL